MYFRDVVANLKYQNDSDSSGIEGNLPDVEGGTESDYSGATEGPEDATLSDDSIMDDDSFLTNQQLQKLYKLPKSLNLVCGVKPNQPSMISYLIILGSVRCRRM